MIRLHDHEDVEIHEFSCHRVCVPWMITKNSTNNVLRNFQFWLSSRNLRISENKENFRIFVKYPGIYFIYDFYNMPQKWPIWKPGNKMTILKSSWWKSYVGWIPGFSTKIRKFPLYSEICDLDWKIRNSKTATSI